MSGPGIHGRTHAAGGTDPIPGLGAGGGIQFDTYPQTGEYLWVRTTGESPQGYGIGFRSESSFQGIDLWADNEDTTPNEIQVGALDSYGVGIAIFGKKGMTIANGSGGDFDISNASDDGQLTIESTGGGAGIRIAADTDLSMNGVASTFLGSSSGDVTITAADDATVNCHDFRVVATGGNFNIQSDTTAFIQASGVGATLHLFGQAGVIVNSSTGERALDVRDDTGAAPIFIINEDGTIHGVTGGSIVWDL